MFLKIKRDYLINFFVAIFLTSSIFLLSFDNVLWAKFWSTLKIPPNYIPFSDFKAHLSFLECYKQFINIYSEECYLINQGNAKISTHPKIWIHLFDLLNLKNKFIYHLVIYIFLFAYLYLFFSFKKNFTKKNEKIFFYFFFLSTSNFLLIERLSTDLIIFLVIWCIVFSSNKIVKISFIYLGFILKYYPIFLLSLFIKQKKYFFGIILIFIFIFFIFFLNDTKNINKNIVEMALPIAYGSRTMLKALYHLSENYSLFLNDSNYNSYRNFIIISFAIYSILLIIHGYLNIQKLNLNTEFSEQFIAGGSIYLGTYIIGANADYRLIFLLFTLPLIFQLKNKLLKNTYLISVFFSINSFYFLLGDKISLIFFITSIIIFFLKFLIFSILSLIIGSQLKKINFFKFKNV